MDFSIDRERVHLVTRPRHESKPFAAPAPSTERSSPIAPFFADHIADHAGVRSRSTFVDRYEYDEKRPPRLDLVTSVTTNVRASRRPTAGVATRARTSLT